MEAILLIARLILSAVFLVAGIAKFADLKGSQKAAADFGAPEKLAKPLGVLLPVAEVCLAILLLPLETAWFGAVFALTLLLVFSGGIAFNIWRGNAADCHCFGQLHSEPVGWSTLIRNSIFASIAGVVVVFGRENAGLSALNWLGELTVAERINSIFGILIVALLAFALVVLRQILAQQRVLQRQIELLEFTKPENSREVEREEAAPPANGLPVGAIAPAFALNDLQGRRTTLESLLSNKKPVLLFFVSPSCNPCQALLPEIEDWQREFGEKVSFVFLSSGKANENVEKFGANNTVLLQTGRELGEAYKAIWTPTIVLVNADGTLGSRLATGDAQIRELIASVRAKFVNLNGHAPKKLFLTENAKMGAAKLGEAAPDFTLPDLEGKPTSLKDFRGNKTLLLFWGTACGFCQQMLDDLRAWERLPQNVRQANLVLVSVNDAESTRAQNFQSTVLLAEDQKFEKLYGVSGTPSGIIVDSDGRVVSEIAVGADEVFALVGYSVKKD